MELDQLFHICSKILPGPLMNNQKRCREIFLFHAASYIRKICVVNEYAATTMTSRTPTVDFESFSPTLKEQLGEIKYTQKGNQGHHYRSKYHE